MKKDKTISWQRVDAAHLDLHGKRAIVVGGTGGLGQAIARQLAARGGDVVVVGQTFRDQGNPRIAFVQADLSRMDKAARVARELPAETADFLIFTAGIFAAPKRQENSEGLERDMAVSFLNRLVMLREMAPRLGTARAPGAPRARVFNMAYPGSGQIGTPDDLNAERGYKALVQHMNTVAGNEILVLDAAERYAGIDAFGLNPGMVKTAIRDNFFGKSRILAVVEHVIGALNPTPEQYAARIVPLIATPDIAGRSGAMFDRKGDAIRPSAGLTPEHIARFLSGSQDLIARTGVQLAA